MQNAPIRIVALLLPFLTVLPEAAGQDSAPAPAGSSVDIPGAVRRGLDIIETLQEGPGGREWPYEGVYRVRQKGEMAIPIGYRVGGTSIAALALLVEGRPAAGSRRTEAVDGALRFVLESLAEPLMSADFAGGYDVRGWGHAYALQFLLRLRALDAVPKALVEDVRRALSFLVGALETTEIPKSGGWNYSRRGTGASPASTFMTAPTLQALFEAARQGLKVRRDVIVAALDTIENARLDTGAFQYGSDPDHRTGKGFEAVPGAIGRMPVCEATLLLAGRGSVERVRESLTAFFEHWQALEDRRKKTGTHVGPYMVAPYYFFYAHYYAAQAIEMLPELERPPLRDALRRRLFEVREVDGSWNDRVFPRSRNFGTAMSLMALLMPDLPPPATYDGRRRSG